VFIPQGASPFGELRTAPPGRVDGAEAAPASPHIVLALARFMTSDQVRQTGQESSGRSVSRRLPAYKNVIGQITKSALQLSPGPLFHGNSKGILEHIT
jgi:hypothetical protein